MYKYRPGPWAAWRYTSSQMDAEFFERHGYEVVWSPFSNLAGDPA